MSTHVRSSISVIVVLNGALQNGSQFSLFTKESILVFDIFIRIGISQT